MPLMKAIDCVSQTCVEKEKRITWEAQPFLKNSEGAALL